ncbi:SirB2 family protein [Pontibacter cellulosilyticus]|uniref:SirB2 family protein n=1 Tax=Pontibacter cellulosilyticus TaxID=1720253 RepID=A0A923N963_9BACT|nr:SirB2 family protein [Pontibacter cellulosilyticus]MBC5992720.1 SirB2 family protein [Pontibacter cellulosilyticus]
MQETVTVLHTHVLVVILFLILFTYKAILLFLNEHKQLNKAKRYTKALDIVFGTLILVTGGYLLYLHQGMPGWLIIKIVLVLLAIPLGIVGIKRHNKLFTGLSLLLFFYTYGLAETKSLTISSSGSLQNTTTDYNSTPVTDATETAEIDSATAGAPEEIVASLEDAQLANAKAIYTQVCETCHGADGTKGLGGAANLKVSTLSLQDRINVVENGRGLMPGFGSQLSEQEVEALAAYTMTLKID